VLHVHAVAHAEGDAAAAPASEQEDEDGGKPRHLGWGAARGGVDLRVAVRTHHVRALPRQRHYCRHHHRGRLMHDVDCDGGRSGGLGPEGGGAGLLGVVGRLGLHAPHSLIV